MTPAPRPVIGILGGMGPAASADLLRKITAATNVGCDRDHYRVIVDSDPTVPDRTAFVLGRGPSPAPRLAANARRLAGWGADLLVIACNTAHVVYDEIAAVVPIPVLDMVSETAQAVARDLPACPRVGLLATTGTIRAALYQRALAAVAVEAVVPDPLDQERVMRSIRAIKAGRPEYLLAPTIRGLLDEGCQALLAACTELPLVLSPTALPVPLVDPTWEVARAVVATARRIQRIREGDMAYAS